MSETYCFGQFVLNPVARTVIKGGVDLALGSRAFDILVALVKAQGEVVTQRQLMGAAWPGLVVDPTNIRVQVGAIRRALSGDCDEDVTYVSSVPGRGYCFTVPVTRLNSQQEHTEYTLVRDPDIRQQLCETVDTDTTLELPAPHTSALETGRCVREISKLVPEHRMVSMIGGDGAGKTTLAILVGHYLTSRYPILFVDLSSVECDKGVIEQLAAALGYASLGASVFDDLLANLATRRVLIIFDNCEHLVEAVASVCSRIVERTTGVHFLCTSREDLRVGGERIHLIRILAPPVEEDAITVDAQ